MGGFAERVDNWIERARRAGYDAEKLARECGISSRHLRRFFLKAAGRSPQNWIDEVRLWDAARLINEGQPIKVVALSLGFKISYGYGGGSDQYTPLTAQEAQQY